MRLTLPLVALAPGFIFGHGIELASDLFAIAATVAVIYGSLMLWTVAKPAPRVRTQRTQIGA